MVRRMITVVAFVALCVGLPASPALATTVTGFNPTSGPVGTSVTLTGTGFTGSGSTCTGTTVKFNGVSSNCTYISPTQIKSNVPALATTGPISVTNSGGTGTSSTNFTVTLGISLSKAIGPPTTSVTVNGSAFDPYSAIDLYFDTSDVALVSANAAGNFSGMAVRVPAMAVPGTHWITAVQRASTPKSAQKAFTVRTDWAQYHNTVKHKGYNAYENVLSPETVRGLDEDWSAATGGTIGNSSPTISGGTAYLGSNDGKLYAFNATTGAKLWDTGTAMSGTISASPAVAGGIVYIATYNGKLFAFDTATGAKLWDSGASIPGGPPFSSPAVANGFVYIGGIDGKLHAFNATTGVHAWDSGSAIPAGAWVETPTIAHGVVYVPTGDNKIYAFDATTHAKLWDSGSTIVLGSGFSAPAVANGIVYVGGDKLYALNASTGAKVWDSGSTLPSYVDTTPAVANGVVYIVPRYSPLYAFNARTGAYLWDSGSASNLYYSSPAVANGVVYAGNLDGWMYAFDTSDGTVLWSAMSGDDVDSSPAIVNGMVYVGSLDGKLRAYDLAAAPSAPARPDPKNLHPNLALRPQE